MPKHTGPWLTSLYKRSDLAFDTPTLALHLYSSGGYNPCAPGYRFALEHQNPMAAIEAALAEPGTDNEGDCNAWSYVRDAAWVASRDIYHRVCDTLAAQHQGARERGEPYVRGAYVRALTEAAAEILRDWLCTHPACPR